MNNATYMLELAGLHVLKAAVAFRAFFETGLNRRNWRSIAASQDDMEFRLSAATELGLTLMSEALGQ